MNEKFYHPSDNEDTIVKISVKGKNRGEVFNSICFETDDYDFEGLQTIEQTNMTSKIIFCKKKNIELNKNS